MSDANREKLLARFWAKVNKTETCWLWTGGTSRASRERSDAYGSFGVGPHQSVRAHRFSYEAAHGGVPPGMVVHHKCGVTLCVNPAHLEATTNKRNILLGRSPSAVHAAKTACPQGHPYSVVDAPQRRYNGTRRCLLCDRSRVSRKCPICMTWFRDMRKHEMAHAERADRGGKGA